MNDKQQEVLNILANVTVTLRRADIFTGCKLFSDQTVMSKTLRELLDSGYVHLANKKYSITENGRQALNKAKAPAFDYTDNLTYGPEKETTSKKEATTTKVAANTPSVIEHSTLEVESITSELDSLCERLTPVTTLHQIPVKLVVLSRLAQASGGEIAQHLNEIHEYLLEC